MGPERGFAAETPVSTGVEAARRRGCFPGVGVGVAGVASTCAAQFPYQPWHSSLGPLGYAAPRRPRPSHPRYSSLGPLGYAPPRRPRPPYPWHSSLDPLGYVRSPTPPEDAARPTLAQVWHFSRLLMYSLAAKLPPSFRLAGATVPPRLAGLGGSSRPPGGAKRPLYAPTLRMPASFPEPLLLVLVFLKSFQPAAHPDPSP